MRDINSSLKQSIIDQLLSSLPRVEYSKLEPVQPNLHLQQYLAFYHLPEGDKNLTLHAGIIPIQDEQLVVMAWEPSTSKETAVIVHGYLDHIGLYSHLIKHLLDRQFTVVCFDLPGHGLSTGAKGHIHTFDSYVDALGQVLDIARTMFSGPLHGIGQSTGGAILAKHLLDHQQPGYPFTSLNLLAPLLHPKHWWWNRWVFKLTGRFRQSIKRSFRSNSSDHNFLYFLRYVDPFQPLQLPLTWVGAMAEWIDELETAENNLFPINLIQGDCDTTLDWRYNLNIYRKAFPAMSIHIVKRAGHHLVNESKPLRDQVFAALQFN